MTEKDWSQVVQSGFFHFWNFLQPVAVTIIPKKANKLEPDRTFKPWVRRDENTAEQWRAPRVQMGGNTMGGDTTVQQYMRQYTRQLEPEAIWSSTGGENSTWAQSTDGGRLQVVRNESGKKSALVAVFET
jgi:hypothetical protein